MIFLDSLFFSIGTLYLPVVSKECWPEHSTCLPERRKEVPVLEATGLSKSYGSVSAVRDVTFRLEPGQVLGYLGPNGSGKSTTVKMLTGLLEPSSGQVTQDGNDIHSNLVAYRKRLGYVPEEANLYPYLTGEEYLEMVGTLRAMPKSRKIIRIDSLLRL